MLSRLTKGRSTAASCGNPQGSPQHQDPGRSTQLFDSDTTRTLIESARMDVRDSVSDSGHTIAGCADAMWGGDLTLESAPLRQDRRSAAERTGLQALGGRIR